MPWDFGIMDFTSTLPKNKGSTYGTSTREPFLENTESASFIHTYFTSYSVNTSYTLDVVWEFHRVHCAMIKNDLVSLLKSSSPVDYCILTPLVWFFSLCALFEAILVHSWGALTLTDIYHMRILKSSVSPTPKRGRITGQSDPRHASVHGN